MALALTACENVAEPAHPVCTAEIRPAVDVRVVDSLSDLPLAGSSTLILQDGAFRDSTTTPPDATTNHLRGSSASYERAGSYTVRVRRSGYAVWERAGVHVVADQCHVQTVQVEARLHALP